MKKELSINAKRKLRDALFVVYSEPGDVCNVTLLKSEVMYFISTLSRDLPVKNRKKPPVKSLNDLLKEKMPL